MISLEQLDGEIAALEEKDPTYVIMQKLAALYTVRDHMVLERNNNPVMVTLETIPSFGESDFARLVAGKEIQTVLSTIDELMTTLAVINPRLYNSVMDSV